LNGLVNYSVRFEDRSTHAKYFFNPSFASYFFYLCKK
jgi:hypothetical protein